MKTLLFLILFCNASYAADITTTNVAGDITTVVSERQDENGKPRWHLETLYRGREKILQVESHLNKEGRMALAWRSYFVGGNLVMSEGDDDGDGSLEHIAIHQPGTRDFELFVRQPDGSVRPESTKKIELLKKEEAVADESLRKLIQKPEVSDQDVAGALKENREKIQGLQKQSQDGKR